MNSSDHLPTGRKVTYSLGRSLDLSTKGGVVVQIEQINPGFNIFSRLGNVPDRFREILQRLGITVGTAALLKRAPLLDFPCAPLMLGMGLNPLQNFSIAFAGALPDNSSGGWVQHPEPRQPEQSGRAAGIGYVRHREIRSKGAGLGVPGHDAAERNRAPVPIVAAVGILSS